LQGLIAGAPNSGKTTFLINFSAFLGLKELKLKKISSEERKSTAALSLPLAQKTLVSSTAHTTRILQSVVIKFPQGKRGKDLELIDSCGLVPGIHPEEEIRLGMATTIDKIISAKIILHLIDLTAFEGDLNVIDQELFELLTRREEYAILGNKIDLEKALMNLPALRKTVRPAPVFPISALHSKGFKEVYHFVLGCF